VGNFFITEVLHRPYRPYPSLNLLIRGQDFNEKYMEEIIPVISFSGWI